MFRKLLVFGEMPVSLIFSKLLGLITCKGSGLSQSATQMWPQGLCSLRSGCGTCEEGSVEDKEGVPVLGVIN